jgi:LysM repeat protein
MALKALNNLKSDEILTGQKLLVPIWPKAQSK